MACQRRQSWAASRTWSRPMLGSILAPDQAPDVRRSHYCNYKNAIRLVGSASIIAEVPGVGTTRLRRRPACSSRSFFRINALRQAAFDQDELAMGRHRRPAVAEDRDGLIVVTAMDQALEQVGIRPRHGALLPRHSPQLRHNAKPARPLRSAHALVQCSTRGSLKYGATHRWILCPRMVINSEPLPPPTSIIHRKSPNGSSLYGHSEGQLSKAGLTGRLRYRHHAIRIAANGQVFKTAGCPFDPPLKGRP